MNNTPDLILFNGSFKALDNGNTEPSAVAICGKYIHALGCDREILAMAGSGTKKIDLKKRLVLPGFTDTHFHFYEWALNYDSIDFSATLNFSEMEAAIRAKAVELGRDKWVLGQGFNESDWPENKIPDRRDLDRAAPYNPVCIWRCDLHLAVANSSALKFAGIKKGIPDPDNGVIVRDSNGIPTGVLKELALNLIRNVIPEPEEEKLLENMQKAISHAHSLGLTGIHDIRLMGGKEGASALKLWQTLHERKKLNIRCHVALPGEMTEQAVALGLRTGFGDDMLKIGYLKFFSDGGMGARTAWVTEKYLDAEYGMPLTPVKEIESAVTKADAAGLSCMVHAVGDRACHEIIKMFSRIEQKKQSRCRIPHRIEHVQMILPEDIKRLRRLKKLAVSCQPNNLSLDISMIEQCAGKRGQYAYNLKNLLNTGIPVMFSSDAPVADPDPFAGIYSAVTRKRMDKTPEDGWNMDQAIGVEEAVTGYTFTPAVVSGNSHILGSISRGKLADLIVTNQNIFDIPNEEIAGVRTDITVFNGKLVYER